MNLTWTPEERQFREAVRAFAAEKLPEDIRAKVLRHQRLRPVASRERERRQQNPARSDQSTSSTSTVSPVTRCASAAAMKSSRSPS